MFYFLIDIRWFSFSHHVLGVFAFVSFPNLKLQSHFKTTLFLEVTFQPRDKLIIYRNVMLFSYFFDFYLSLSSIQISFYCCSSLSLPIFLSIFLFFKTLNTSSQLLLKFLLQKIYINSIII